MTEKAIKSREEWKDIINNLSFPDFQNLIYDLLKALKFTDIKQRGGGPDGGRDLEAYYIYNRPNGEENRVKCWIQCKKQGNGVSFSQIHEDISRAFNQKIDEYYIISNYDTTPDCKDELEKGRITWSCKIIDWTGLKFQDILFSFPDICRYYFPDEDIPSITNIRRPSEALDLSTEVGKRYGLNLSFKIEKQVDLNNPTVVADILKDAILKLQNIDVNLQALIYHKISMLFFGLEKIEDALMFLNRSLDITPNNIEVLLNKGFILEKIDEVDESNIIYDEILTIDPNNKFALNNKSYNLRRMGFFEDALKLIEKALEVDPNFILAINNKAEALKGLKRSKDALMFLDEKKDLLNKSINLKNIKVLLCIDLLDLKQGYLMNESILNDVPNYLDAINNKGVIYERNSKYQNRNKYLALALECFEKTTSLEQKYAIGYSNKSIVMLNLGSISDAEKVIDIAYAMFPKNPQVLCKKGIILLSQKKPKEAEKYFINALRLWFDEEFLVNKAGAELDQRHYKESIITCEKLIKYNPEEAQAWTIKGLALRALHQPNKASLCFKKAKKWEKKPISLLE
jgi:tetratricopeptide (TPR) repeat protein